MRREIEEILGAFINVPLRLLGVLWAAPYTVLGLLIGLIGIGTGGHGRIRGPVIEFYGGGVKWLLHRFPHGQFTMAFTRGHTVLGQTNAALDICREHDLLRGLLGDVSVAILLMLVPFGTSGKELAARRANGGHFYHQGYRNGDRNGDRLAIPGF